MKLPQFIVLVSLTVGPQLRSWQSLFSHGLTCQGGCLPFAPWPQLLVHLQRWAAVRIEPLVGKAAYGVCWWWLLLKRGCFAIYIYIYIYIYYAFTPWKWWKNPIFGCGNLKESACFQAKSHGFLLQVPILCC